MLNVHSNITKQYHKRYSKIIVSGKSIKVVYYDKAIPTNTLIMEELLELIPKIEGYGKDKVTIIEGSSSLHSYSSVMNFRNFLIENKIKHNIVYNLDMMDNKLLIETIKNCLGTILVFETTGISESFSKVKQIIVSLSNNGYRFNLIECGYRGYFTVNKVPTEAKKENISFHQLECLNKNISKWKLEKRN